MRKTIFALIFACSTLTGYTQTKHFDYVKLFGMDTTNFDREHFSSQLHSRYFYNIPGIYMFGFGGDWDRPWVVDSISILWESNPRRWMHYTPWEMEEMINK
jgi:hypothetical protein